MEDDMDAVRCPECGDVRWSFFGFAARSEPMSCELCGTQMVPERRRPKGVGVKPDTRERRHAVVTPLPRSDEPTLPPAA